MTIPYKLLPWINEDKIFWTSMSGNPRGIQLLEKNPDKICWSFLARYPRAIGLIEKNLDKVDLSNILSVNSAAVPILEKNLDKINWYNLSMNT